MVYSDQCSILLIFRHSINRWPADRVNKHLLQAITVRSIDREKRDHVNLITLRFKRSHMERRVSSTLYNIINSLH